MHILQTDPCAIPNPRLSGGDSGRLPLNKFNEHGITFSFWLDPVLAVECLFVQWQTRLKYASGQRYDPSGWCWRPEYSQPPLSLLRPEKGFINKQGQACSAHLHPLLRTAREPVTWHTCHLKLQGRFCKINPVRKFTRLAWLLCAWHSSRTGVSLQSAPSLTIRLLVLRCPVRRSKLWGRSPCRVVAAGSSPAWRWRGNPLAQAWWRGMKAHTGSCTRR